MFHINMEMCDQITGIYETQAEECVRAVQGLYASLEEIIAKTHYYPIARFGNQICTFYKEDLRSHLMGQFREWYDSGYSFHALMAAINAGDDAIGQAKRKMDQMESSLYNLFAVPLEEHNLSGLSEPNIKDVDFERFQEALKKSISSFETARSEAKSRVNAMGSENDVVLLIGDIVETTGSSLEESFQEFVRQVMEGQDFTNEQKRSVVGRLTGRGKTLGSKGMIPWPKGFSSFR